MAINRPITTSLTIHEFAFIQSRTFGSSTRPRSQGENQERRKSQQQERQRKKRQGSGTTDRRGWPGRCQRPRT
jgi:hypothetical protein